MATTGIATRARRPLFVLATESGSLLAVAALLALLLQRVGSSLRGASEVLLAAAALPFGVALADLLSGIAHWAGDTFLGEDTPFLGPLLIRPFREHHRDPLAITRHAFVERNANSALGALPIAGLGLAPHAPAFASAAALACALAVFVTNELHAWAHAETAPRSVRWLQRHGVILSPERHAAHHRSLVAGYCVTTGWTSALLDRALSALGARRGAS